MRKVNFSINSQIYFENRGTEGYEAEAIISSVEGRDVNFVECKVSNKEMILNQSMVEVITRLE